LNTKEKKAMYKLTARQILLIALISGIFAAVSVAVINRVANRLQPIGSALSEKSPPGITDPTVAGDEQNNIEIYRTLSPPGSALARASLHPEVLGVLSMQSVSGEGTPF
jgi:hypothetical protein